MTKKYYKDLDVIRLLACIAVLLYHLNILKGGYLAVCTFFVLSGYLACNSAFKKEKFSIGSYYINRLLHIYLPLVIIVFISIFAVSFLSSSWISLKPETTSVLLGYNNFWQLDANLDYFARHVDSPFMHLWYIGILLQFEIVFPFIFMLFKKIGDKVHKVLPCILLGLGAIIGGIYFYSMSGNSKNIMVVYYSTFTRLFSIIFGLLIGFIHHYYKPCVFKNKIINRIIFIIYLSLLTFLVITVPADSKYFAIAMIGTTLITCRLISYGTIIVKNKLNILDKAIKLFASISYEVYLLQYPVYYIFQDIKMNQNLKITFIIIIVVALAAIIHFALNFKAKKQKSIRYILCFVLAGFTFYGTYQYIAAKDHTKEMKQLEEQLNQNAELMQNKQAEYAKKLKESEETWAKDLSAYDNIEEKVADKVKNMPIICIGDSVMLGASTNIYEMFPNAYVDAKVSRTDYEANGILTYLKNNEMLGEPIIIHLGTNGECGNTCRNAMMETIGDRKVFWLTVTNDADVHINDGLKEYLKDKDNSYIIDWENISKGHSEYFYGDGIHLIPAGREIYAQTLYDSIYKIYLDEKMAEKEKLLKEYEDVQNSKITFYGNDLLVNSYDIIHKDFENALYVTDNNFTFKSLKESIENAIADDSLAHKLVFVFDKKVRITKEEYQTIINLCEGHKIYIINMTDNLYDFNNDSVTVLEFKEIIKANKNYLMADNIHLTAEGNVALGKYIGESIK